MATTVFEKPMGTEIEDLKDDIEELNSNLTSLSEHIENDLFAKNYAGSLKTMTITPEAGYVYLVYVGGGNVAAQMTHVDYGLTMIVYGQHGCAILNQGSNVTVTNTNNSSYTISATTTLRMGWSIIGKEG